MGTIDFDKFLASFITAMKECSRMKTFSIPVCIKKALEEQGLEYKEGEIVKSQRRVSAEAKENGYSESEDERIRKTLIENFKFFGGDFLETSKWGKDDDLLVTDIIAWLERQGRKPAEWKQENREELTEFENAMMHIGGSFFGERAGLDPNDTDTIKEQAELLLELAPKTEWSEEDRTMAFTLMRDVDQISYISKEGKNERIGWLNSLDEKFASRESTWSEEDERIYQSIIDDTVQENQLDDKQISWIKSLKLKRRNSL